MSVGKGKVLVHTGEMRKLSNGKAFVGDSVYVFFKDKAKARAYGTLNDIGPSYIVLNGIKVPFSEIETFDIGFRGEEYPLR